MKRRDYFSVAAVEKRIGGRSNAFWNSTWIVMRRLQRNLRILFAYELRIAGMIERMKGPHAVVPPCQRVGCGEAVERGEFAVFVIAVELVNSEPLTDVVVEKLGLPTDKIVKVDDHSGKQTPIIGLQNLKRGDRR